MTILEEGDAEREHNEVEKDDVGEGVKAVGERCKLECGFFVSGC